MATNKKNEPEGDAGRTVSRSGERSDSPILSRRSLLSWLGSATVLSLTSGLLSACETEFGRPALNSSRTPKNAKRGSGAFAFSPSPEEGTLYDTWWGNTVDKQDLSQILAAWELKVDGLVENPISLSFSELLALPRQDQTTDFHCVEGWSVLDVPWNGVHIDRLIERVRPTNDATHLTIRCVGDVYTESLPLAVAREHFSLLAYGIDGKTMPLTHGFPLRVVVPRLYGYKNAKWVKQLEFTNASIDGYWEQRGYPTDAPVKAAILRAGKY